MEEKFDKTEKNDARVTIPPELVAEARAGDQAAFTELYELTSTELYRSVRSMVRDEDLAWDILQDSYVRAWKSIEKLDADEAFLTWLRRIAVNVTATEMAQKRTLTFSELAGDENEGAAPDIPDLNIDNQPELALDRKETSRLVREILAELPEEQQLIVGMRYYEDMPVSEIAETLHIAVGTVKAQLFKGRKKIEAGVRGLEKQGVKLYGLSPLPFLIALLRRLEPVREAERGALAATLTEAPAISAATGAAVGTSVGTVTALTAGQAFLKGLGVRLLAGGLAVAVLAVGGKLIYDALKDGKFPRIGDERPSMEDSVPLRTSDLRSEREETDIASGNYCGPNLTWSFDSETGTLTIEGSGIMNDYDRLGTPWASCQEAIQTVQFSDGITSLGCGTFMNCTALLSADIPDSVTTIGDYAFYNCTGLSSVTIPDSVTSIGKYAFSNCTELSTLTIPDSVTSIGGSAFCDCTGLATITIPQSVTSIEDNTFSGCYGLVSATICDGVTSIGNRAFYFCDHLTSITIPKSVTSIDTDAFNGCSQLSAFSVHPDNPACFSDESGILYSKDHTELIVCPCGKRGQIVIPGSVTRIRDNAFCGCRSLTSVTIPDSVTLIGSYAFMECTGLTTLKIPSNVTRIETGTFVGCSELTNVTLPDSVTSIGPHAFYDCIKLTAVSIPDGLTCIDNYSFYNCSGLTSVTIPESVTSIGDCAFQKCSGLTSVLIPEQVTSISYGAFQFCPNLTLRGKAGSEAERYAKNNGIPFEAIP